MDGKRWFDVLTASVGLIGFAPVLAAAAVAIRAEDGGPVLFIQERVGRYGVPFRIVKLRTMKDREVTRVGRWLRATGIDEIPQFINVIEGTMAVVGPRPLTHGDLERLGWITDRERAKVLPGITGPAQLFAGAGAEISRALDARYARDRSARLDAEIIAWSFAINIFGKQRVRRWLAVTRSDLAR